MAPERRAVVYVHVTTLLRVIMKPRYASRT
jgi:hypothetical protein